MNLRDDFQLFGMSHFMEKWFWLHRLICITHRGLRTICSRFYMNFAKMTHTPHGSIFRTFILLSRDSILQPLLFVVFSNSSV